MTLKEYMKLNNKNRQEICDELGICQSTLSYWMSGQRYPCRFHLVKILEVTKGKVTPNDFMGDDDND